MTPKGAAVLPRPFCCHFAFCRGRFAALFLLFSFPLSLSSCSPRPATFCELLPVPMVTLCELLPVPPAGKVYILPTFACAPFWQSWHFVNFWRHFAHPLSTACKLSANFRPRPLGQSLHFVNFWRHFAHLRRALCHLLLPFLPYFRFFCKL